MMTSCEGREYRKEFEMRNAECGVRIPFYKMSGSGNDFILIDNRDGILSGIQLDQFARRICRRKVSIGADGLILIEPSRKAAFKWQFFNADGSEADMCGNGGRCVARLAHLLGIAPKKMTFETRAGIISAEVEDRKVKIGLTPPSHIRTDIAVPLDGETILLHSINIGVPHVVKFDDRLEEVDVKGAGQKIRFHSLFQPAGTNVNWIKIISKDTIEVRTYERGVEDETLACGTGAVASALIASIKAHVQPPVMVKTRGGEILTVYFTSKGEEFEEVSFEGEVSIIYQGEMWDEAYGD
jgi:diaminopimelate epimerase